MSVEYIEDEVTPTEAVIQDLATDVEYALDQLVGVWDDPGRGREHQRRLLYTGIVTQVKIGDEEGVKYLVTRLNQTNDLTNGLSYLGRRLTALDEWGRPVGCPEVLWRVPQVPGWKKPCWVAGTEDDAEMVREHAGKGLKVMAT